MWQSKLQGEVVHALFITPYGQDLIDILNAWKRLSLVSSQATLLLFEHLQYGVRTFTNAWDLHPDPMIWTVRSISFGSQACSLQATRGDLSRKTELLRT
jgi:hypothetical protein